MSLLFLPPWLLLIVSLPTSGATARTRIWRALKSLGCMALRDGAYLLPAGEEREVALQELAEECRREGGHAWLMDVQPRSVDEAATYRQLFDRSDDYAALCKSWKEAGRTLSGLAGSEVSRMQRRLQRERYYPLSVIKRLMESAPVEQVDLDLLDAIHKSDAPDPGERVPT